MISKRFLISIVALTFVCIAVFAAATRNGSITTSNKSNGTKAPVASNGDSQSSAPVREEVGMNVTGKPTDLSNEIPDDIRQRVVDDFGQERADEIYDYLLDRIPNGLINGTRPRHLRCILYLAKGDKERLDRYIEMCLSDTRDVMVAAEYEAASSVPLIRKRDFGKPFDLAQIQTD
jgi:hypothetical protein